MIGYTDKQARTALARIDRALARTEDSLSALSAAIPDHHETPHLAQEAARDTANRLAQIVARRMRQPVRDDIAQLGIAAVVDEVDFRIKAKNIERGGQR